MANNYEDSFGIEIEGLEKAKTNNEKIVAIERHLTIIEGLYNEATTNLENKIYKLKCE